MNVRFGSKWTLALNKDEFYLWMAMNCREGLKLWVQIGINFGWKWTVTSDAITFNCECIWTRTLEVNCNFGITLTLDINLSFEWWLTLTFGYEWNLTMDWDEV